jgi:hypothetical protein
MKKLPMHNALGYSLYLSSFAAQCSALGGCSNPGTTVFLSLHISEEFDESYCSRAEEICHKLADMGFRIIADVSKKTQAQFGCNDLVELAKKLRLWAIRIDYGFSVEEIAGMAARIPLVVNASTVTARDARIIAAGGKQVFAMHNFYPRPETGLDEHYLLETTRSLQEAGLKVLAFIPGDSLRRGPLHEGLPTLEAHRNLCPSAAFVDLRQRFGIDGIFLGDPGISPREAAFIHRYCREGVISVPARLEEGYHHLYDRVFTCRVDSPEWLVRFQESRTYSCPGQALEPECCDPRTRGSITVDNCRYGRYSGEVMMIRRDLPPDPRVNVIGRVSPGAWPLMDNIRRGQKFTLVRMDG